MSPDELVFYMTQALYLVLSLSLPAIGVAAIVGTLFSLFQALTQLQEQTLSFAVKLIAVFVTLFLVAGWMGREILNFSLILFDVSQRVR
jgi:type III secretion protein S